MFIPFISESTAKQLENTPPLQMSVSEKYLFSLVWLSTPILCKKKRGICGLRGDMNLDGFGIVINKNTQLDG